MSGDVFFLRIQEGLGADGLKNHMGNIYNQLVICQEAIQCISPEDIGKEFLVEAHLRLDAIAHPLHDFAGFLSKDPRKRIRP